MAGCATVGCLVAALVLGVLLSPFFSIFSVGVFLVVFVVGMVLIVGGTIAVFMLTGELGKDIPATCGECGHRWHVSR